MNQTEDRAMHIGLHVSDISKTEKFYQILFGTDPVKSEPDYLKFELANPKLVISFIQKKGMTEGPDFGHLGIRVNSEEAVEEWHQRVKSSGLHTREEKEVACCYAVQKKFWVTDPDGYEWEVYQFLGDIKQKVTDAACCN